MNALLVRGFRLAKAGQRDQAYDTFNQVVRLDPSNEYGWLWRAQTTDDLAEAYVCLQRVLSINPNNEKAQQGIDRIKNRVAGESLDLSGGAFETSSSGFTGRGNPQPAPPPEQFDPNSFLSGGTGQESRPAQTYGYQEPEYAPGPTTGGYGAQPEPAPPADFRAAPPDSRQRNTPYTLPTTPPPPRPTRRRGGFPIWIVIVILVIVVLLLLLLQQGLSNNNNTDGDSAATSTANANGGTSGTVGLVSDADQTATSQANTALAGGNPVQSGTRTGGTATVSGGNTTPTNGGQGQTTPATTGSGPNISPTAASLAPGNPPVTTAAPGNPPVTTAAPANPPTNTSGPAAPAPTNTASSVTTPSQPRPLAYRVLPGNNLPTVATGNKTTADAIVAANKGRTFPGTGLPIVGAPNTIYANTTLIIPVGRPDYRGQGVILGENGLNSVQDVATKYGKALDDLVRFNGLNGAGDAKAGDAILVP